jgi:hypothetical protein
MADKPTVIIKVSRKKTGKNDKLTNVTCQFRANEVLLHHNGNIATMKRRHSGPS